MFKPDHQRDADVMQYGRTSSKAIGRNPSGGRPKQIALWNRKREGTGRGDGEPIEKIKALMASFTDRGSLEPLSAWHPFPHEALEDGKVCEEGKMEEGIYKFSLGGNGLSAVG